MSIMGAMALGVGLENEDYFVPTHPGHNNQLRLLHYPPVPAGNIESQASTRLGAHSDWGSITMVFQDDCGGLQVNPFPCQEHLLDELTSSRLRALQSRVDSSTCLLCRVRSS